MDPTGEICLIADSFKRVIPSPIPEDWLPRSITIQDYKSVTLDPQILTTEGKSVPFGDVNSDRYLELQRIKGGYGIMRQIDEQSYMQAKRETNRFEKVGNSIFMNRASIKLANIDAIYNVTTTFGGLMKMRSDGKFYFCDIAAGPGGFTQYLQFRNRDAVGYGITLKTEDNLDWNRNKLNMEKFVPIEGKDGSGNLYTNWKYFVNQVLTFVPTGVDLVTGDGGFDVEEDENIDVDIEKIKKEKKKGNLDINSILKEIDVDNVLKSGYSQQEFLSSRLLLTQILTAISVLQEGGKFVCKLFDTVTTLSGQLLYITALSFEKVSIFKPVSSRPANSERYLVCEGKRPFTAKYTALLEEANNRYTTKENVIQLFSNPLPEDFESWLFDQNMLSIDRQISTGKNIFDTIEGKKIFLPEYDLNKALAIWNIPGNIVRLRI